MFFRPPASGNVSHKGGSKKTVVPARASIRIRAPPSSSRLIPTPQGRDPSVAGLPGRRTPARYGPRAVTPFGEGGFSVHQRDLPNCHHSIPVARWCGSSNVIESADAETTVQMIAAKTKAMVSPPRTVGPTLLALLGRSPLPADMSHCLE